MKSWFIRGAIALAVAPALALLFILKYAFF